MARSLFPRTASAIRYFGLVSSEAEPEMGFIAHVFFFNGAKEEKGKEEAGQGQ